MIKSIFCLALATACALSMTMVAQSRIDIDKNKITTTDDKCQHNSHTQSARTTQNTKPTMFSNIDLTPQQKELLSSLENPFAEDYMTGSLEKSRMSDANGEMLDRCGGDPRFQSSDEVLDLVFQELHQQRTDARVQYLQRVSEVLTPQQYEQFIKNLDSMGRVE